MTWDTTACQLCGVTSLDVSRAVVVYLEPDLEGNRYHSIRRCKDHAACRERVERDGETWPLEEPRRRTA
jgi:hypothetical protein